jgi:hypothetical protein
MRGRKISLLRENVKFVVILFASPNKQDRMYCNKVH